MRRPRLPVGFELDLIPVMSLIVHIVPMLLLGIRFSTVSALPAGGPVLPVEPAPGPTEFQEQEDKVVSVRITSQGFVVGGTPDADPRIPCRGDCALETYDYAALSQAMIAAKARQPTERRVVIVPEPWVPFEVLVRVLDHTRAIGSGSDQRDLFPVPLLATPTPS